MSDRRTRRDNQDASDFQAAANRLEEAVSDLMSTATGRVTDGATRLLDDAAKAIRSEVDSNDQYQRASRSERFRSATDGIDPSSDRLQRDSVNGKLAGVCAGIARYYGVEAWMVRCLTITLFLFMPTIVFPAYWIAYFVLGSDAGSSRTRRRRRSRRGRRGSRASRETATEESPGTPTEELRSTRSVFDQLEMRLRRMESHVTSGRYDLQRELRKIEPRPGASA